MKLDFNNITPSITDDFLIGKCAMIGSSIGTIDVALLPEGVPPKQWAKSKGMFVVLTRIKGLQKGEYLDHRDLETLKVVDRIINVHKHLVQESSWIDRSLEHLVRTAFIAGMKYSARITAEVIDHSRLPGE
jgi:hypothetical protein